MTGVPESLDQARERVVDALKEAWLANQLTELEFGKLAKAAGAAATMDELLSVAAEMRARTDRIAEILQRIRGITERDGGGSLGDAREALIEKLKALWSEDQLAQADFERLAQAVGRASGADDLLDVAAQLRALMKRNDDVLRRLRDALNFDEPWPKPRSDGDGGRQLLDEAALAAVLAPGSPFSGNPDYEDRKGQREMLRLVARRFNEGGIGLIEAGTGTGKSLAYLLPAASWALKNRERTIVSTNTINLQQQIVDKDLPLAQGALGEPLAWALVKGRGNYVSIRRARLAARAGGDLLGLEGGTDLDAIAKWLEKTEDGSKSDLPAKPAAAVWNEVKSDADACLRDKCPHYQECFYYRARRGIADADVLVVNHALFFADLNVRIAADNFENRAVLPRYRRVVFDEAHHVEKVATDSLKTELQRSGALALLSRIVGGRSRVGLLPAVAAAVRAQEGASEEELLRRLLEEAPKAVDAARSRTRECFDALSAWTRAAARTEAEGGRRAGEGDPIRLPAAHAGEPADHAPTRAALDNLLAALGDVAQELNWICDRVETICDRMEEEKPDDDAPTPPGAPYAPGDPINHHAFGHGTVVERVPASTGFKITADFEGVGRKKLLVRPRGSAGEAESPKGSGAARRRFGEDLRGRLLDLRSSRARLAKAGADLGRCLLPGETGDADETEWVRWIEMTRVRGGKRDVRVGAAPVNAGPVLREHLFERIDSAVLTSASMAVRGSFDHFRRWTGLDDLRVHEAVVDSPFDYGQQALLAVRASDDHGQRGDMRPAETARALHDIAEITGGGILALFTSHDALRRTSEEFEAMVGARWEVFTQGTRSRDALLRDFSRAGNGILLGTASFWEGVDVPGRSLRALVVHKLPFPVPSEPVLSARKEMLEMRGMRPYDAWEETSVPVAGLRLKQGVGRLIRTRRDRGAVVLLDPRVRTKGYGPRILEALPAMPLRYDALPSLLATIGEFYAGQDAAPVRPPSRARQAEPLAAR